ncbi:MAG: two-component system sensor histidine kinase NtrB [Candidatus Thermochlorobacter sp.]
MPSVAIIAQPSVQATFLMRIITLQSMKAELFTPDFVDAIDPSIDIAYVEVLDEEKCLEIIGQLHEKFWSMPIVGFLPKPRMDLVIEAFRAGANDVLIYSGDMMHDSIEATDSVHRALRQRQKMLLRQTILINSPNLPSTTTPVQNGFIYQLPQPVIVMDKQLRIASLNHAAEDIIGLNEANACGKDVSLFFSISVEERERILSGQSFRSEMLVQHGDDVKTIGYSISPRVRDNGELDGAVMIFKDITEDRRKRQQAEKTEKMQTLGEIAAAISHEVKNPLAGIKSMVQAVLIDLDEKSEPYQYLKRVLQEVDRINNFIESTFAFARHRRPRIIRSAIPEILESVIALLSENLKQHNVELVREYAEDLPTLRVDPDQIRQVFLNIMLNAIEAMTVVNIEKKKLSISVKPITLKHGKDEIRYLDVQFQDTGPGVPDEVLTKIFDPFFTTKPNGTGLGLAICFKIVSEHGGRIDVSHAVEGGAIVSVKLPLIFKTSYETSPIVDALQHER